MSTNIIRSLASVQLATVLGTITQAPGRFLGQVRTFMLEEPNVPLFGNVRIESYEDESPSQRNDNAAYISKIVLAKAEQGTYSLIVTNRPVHRTNILAIAGAFNPNTVRFGNHGNAKGDFFQPEGSKQYAYLVAPDGKVLYLAADRQIEFGKKPRLNATKWEFARNPRGQIFIQALTQDGKVYNMQNL
ncbi:MAG TPA: hypothetical protein PKA32_02380, partial [Candidatus Gracilibacteria bacterium]|nr:hypothetical protein [Candidatus Gracilibacteria bacterium]